MTINSGWVSTRKQEVARVYRLSSFLATMFVIAGASLSMTALFLAAGVFLAGLGILLYPAGRVAGALVARLHSYRPWPCPECGQVNEVNRLALGVHCDLCGAYWEAAPEAAREPDRQPLSP